MEEVDSRHIPVVEEEERRPPGVVEEGIRSLLAAVGRVRYLAEEADNLPEEGLHTEHSEADIGLAVEVPGEDK